MTATRPVEHLSAAATIEELHTVLARDGALVIDDLAPTDLVDQVMAEISWAMRELANIKPN